MQATNLPKTARGRNTLEKIYTAAEKIFEKKGYYEASISEIALTANVAIGTLYIYFKDKLSLYRYVLDRYSHEIRKASAVGAAPYTSRYDQEFYGFKAYLQYISKHPGAYRIIWESQYVCPEYFQQYYENFSDKYIQQLETAQTKGEIVDCDLSVASYFLIGAFTMFGLKKCIFDNAKEITDEDVDSIMKLIKNGLFK